MLPLGKKPLRGQVKVLLRKIEKFTNMIRSSYDNLYVLTMYHYVSHLF